jgi:hypothetical protein
LPADDLRDVAPARLPVSEDFMLICQKHISELIKKWLNQPFLGNKIFLVKLLDRKNQINEVTAD